jgi:hypothetical protein
MATLTHERGQNNPRMQCDCCGKWKRIHASKPYMSKGGYEATQIFFGGCSYGNGDHLAGHDVCDDCCHTECKRIAAERGVPPST